MTAGELPVRRIGTLVVAELPEEIDLLNVAGIQQQLTALLRERPSAMIADMTQTRYCDSAGVATLVRLSKAAAAEQITVRVAASAPVLRIMRLLGADRVIETHPSLAAALGDENSPRPLRRPSRRSEPESPGGAAPAREGG